MTEKKQYVLIRTEQAGVFVGYLESKEGREVTLSKARRIWRWAGAASVSQLAVDGTSNPSECKFPAEVSEETIYGWVEIIKVSEKAQKSIEGVPIWKE